MNAERLKFTLSLMTKTQSRRWKLYFKHKSLVKIAEIEGVAPPAIHQSLHAGIKKAKKQLKIEIFALQTP